VSPPNINHRLAHSTAGWPAKLFGANNVHVKVVDRLAALLAVVDHVPGMEHGLHMFASQCACLAPPEAEEAPLRPPSPRAL
jgi:hypothetical protein